MSDTLAEIGQRLERLKSNTFENSVSPSSVEEDNSSSHFHMLPSFYGLPNEDPLAHITEFYKVVSGLPL